LLGLAAIVLAGCGGEPAPAGGGEGAAGGGTVLAGTMTGYITQAEAGGITLDEIEVLSGEEAAAAREEDGEPPAEDGLDVPYLRNTAQEAYEIPVASDVLVQVFDCSAECRLVDWEYDDLVSGTPLPYGTAESPFTVTVHEGEVVEIAEIYLP
jgi:hypothetical protein